jgi:hypothetical protein
VPETSAERDAIHAQLERLLANPRFRHSKRYPVLLRYVVEHTLNGSTAQLKERTLGVEVFGRDPVYDTNQDPVVRTTAGEIRKRIAQYYHEPGHQDEIRIDLPPGSYVPEFHLPVGRVIVPVPRTSLKWPVGLIAAALVIVVAVAWIQPWRAPTALELFWRPILDSPNPVLLCVGQPRLLSRTSGVQPSTPEAQAESEIPVTVQDLHSLGNQHVALSDATTLSRVAGLLQSRGKAYHIRGRATTTFTDLRDGPVVLIGAFNNEWTLRLTDQQRFSFERDPKAPEISRIRDRLNPSNLDWQVDYSMPYTKLTSDYAIVARVLDPTLERMVVVAAGIAKFGTVAAGEFLTDPERLQTLLKQAPSNWERKNFEAVIETKVINGNSGPPRIVATHFW